MGIPGVQHAASFADFRFQVFDRPCLLAVLVGVFQAFFLLIIFVLFMHTCEHKQFVGGSPTDVLITYSLNIGQVTCIEQVKTTWQNGEFNNCFLYDDDDASFSWCADADEINRKLRDEGWNTVNPNDRRLGVPRCPFALTEHCTESIWPDGASLVGIREMMEDTAKGSAWLAAGRECVYHTWHTLDHSGKPWDGHTNNKAKRDGAQMIMYRQCPNFFFALGSALGYSGFIQFGGMVIIMSILWAAGVIKKPEPAVMSMTTGEVIDETKVGRSINSQGSTGNAWTAPQQP